MDDTFGALRCTLLDRRSSAPLRGARVTCVWRDDRVSALTTDAHGAFLAELPQGVYDLVISARGYLSLSVRGVGILAGYRQALVRGLVPGDGATLEGEPSTALAGYIADRIRAPIANVAVHLNAERNATAYTTRTDRSGAYVLHSVSPGMYDLTVRTADRIVAHEHVAIAHVRELVRRDINVVQHETRRLRSQPQS